MKLTSLVFTCIWFVCSQATAQSDSTSETKKPSTLSKTTKILAKPTRKPEKNIASPNADSDSEKMVFPGEFVFKGLSIGQTRNGVFSGGSNGRIVLERPSDLKIVGFLLLPPQKNVESIGYSTFACSKELGAAPAKEYEQELSRKERETKSEFDAVVYQIRTRQSVSEYQLSYAADAAKKAITANQLWIDAKGASKTGYAECQDTIANRPVISIQLSFYNNELGLIGIIFDAKDFDIVEGGLTEKYGRPFRSSKAQLNIKLTGAPSNYVSTQWKDSKGNLLTVASHEQDGSVFREQGILIIESTEFTERLAEERKRGGAIPASKDM